MSNNYLVEDPFRDDALDILKRERWESRMSVCPCGRGRLVLTYPQ